MPATLAEHLDKKVGAAVDDFGVVFEIGPGVDHAEHLDDILDPIEIAAQRIPDRRDQDEAYVTGVQITLLDRHAGAELASGHPPVGVLRAFARKIEQIADPLDMDIVADRATYLRKGDPQLFQPLLNAHLAFSQIGESASSIPAASAATVFADFCAAVLVVRDRLGALAP